MSSTIDIPLQQTAEDGNFSMSFISLFASLLIIIVFLLNDNLRSTTYYFLFVIAIAELLGNISTITIYCLTKEKPLSIVLSSVQIFADILVTTFITFIAHTIYRLIIKSERDLDKQKRFYILIGTIGSLIYTGLILLIHFISIKDDIKDEYLSIKKNYYVNSKPFTKRLSEFIHYSVILIMTFFNVFYFIQIMIFLVQKSKQDKKNGYKLIETRNMLISYPLAGTSWIIFSFVAFLINLIMDVKYKDEMTNNNDFKRIIYVFIYIANLFTYLRGFFICIIFLKSKKVKKIATSLGVRLYECMKKMNMILMPSK